MAPVALVAKLSARQDDAVPEALRFRDQRNREVMCNG